MPGMTNRLKYALLATYFRADATQEPTGFRARLINNAVIPGPDTDLGSELTEIPAGNGYVAGGIALARDNIDFDVLTEDDVNDRALIQTKDLVWTAAGGPLPSAGGAYYVSLEDDEVSPQVLGYFNLNGPVSVSPGQSLTLQNPEFRLNEL